MLDLHIGVKPISLINLMDIWSMRARRISAKVAREQLPPTSLYESVSIAVDGDDWEVWGQPVLTSVPAKPLHVVLRVPDVPEVYESDVEFLRKHVVLYPMQDQPNVEFNGVIAVLTRHVHWSEVVKDWRE